VKARSRAGAPGAWLLLLAASGCDGGGGRTLQVASKTFTESVVLGEIALQVARAAGTPAQHRRGLGGTRLVWNALVGGQVDIYPDYSGTLFEEIFRGQGGRQAGEEGLARLGQLLERQGLGMIGPLGFNNTYALGMREEVAQRLGVRTVSDLVAHPQLRFGFSNEFMSRQDGWPSLRRRYGLPQTSVQGIDHDLAYRGLQAGDIEVVDLYSTDAEIRFYGLRALEDDRSHFPRYDAVLVYRRDAEARFPAAFQGLHRLAGVIPAATMTDLNARAKIERQPEAAVAAGFLEQRLGYKVALETTGRARSILRRSGEHLVLVSLSLAAAILVAIPLGVVAWRRPRVGRVVLAAVGIVQTIPSLALLVFMVPLLGLGAVPAMTALFLYGLLPIVRNTHAGLAGVPPDLRQSAEALGLERGAILRLVELPLASRSILTGIKSAAVINVGTATLGALVGAGGFGQPIFTGVRLDDVGLILEGAVPASLLALAVQAMFDALERVVIPRGLRLSARTLAGNSE
jgi:osmoprotectant transport system permease protein